MVTVVRGTFFFNEKRAAIVNIFSREEVFFLFLNF